MSIGSSSVNMMQCPTQSDRSYQLSRNQTLNTAPLLPAPLAWSTASSNRRHASLSRQCWCDNSCKTSSKTSIPGIRARAMQHPACLL
jgi:hypothetical protein